MAQDKESPQIDLTGDSSDNQIYNLQQPIYLNQIPLVQNQQLVYQVEDVQNINNLNFTNGNAQQNFVYIVVPTTNENVQIETLPVELLKKDKPSAFSINAYEKSGNDIKEETDNNVTHMNKFLVNEPESDPLEVSLLTIF